MKNITDKIYEAYRGYSNKSDRPYRPYNIELHFRDLIPAYLYYAEFAGQISDGKYENARPYNHYEWIIGAKITVDGNEYYTTSARKIPKRYVFSNFVKDIERGLNGDKDYLWTLRILNFGRLAKVLESFGEKEIDKGNNFETIAYIYGDTLALNPNAEFEDTESAIYDYRKKATSSKLYSKKYFDAFKKTEYSLKEVKDDIKSMCKTINTHKIE